MLDASMYNILSVFTGAGVYEEHSGMDELRPGEESLASVLVFFSFSIEHKIVFFFFFGECW